jgi:hypothetical protein
MNWIKRRWQGAVVLGLAVAAVAVPAWASSGGGGDVQGSSRASSSGGDGIAAASVPARARDAVPFAPPINRKQLDQAVRCMASHGFGMGKPSGRGTLISRAETKTKAFRRAAKQCELPRPPKKIPRPPTGAQLRQFGCPLGPARREGSD